MKYDHFPGWHTEWMHSHSHTNSFFRCKKGVDTWQHVGYVLCGLKKDSFSQWRWQYLKSEDDKILFFVWGFSTAEKQIDACQISESTNKKPENASLRVHFHSKPTTLYFDFPRGDKKSGEKAKACTQFFSLPRILQCVADCKRKRECKILVALSSSLSICLQVVWRRSELHTNTEKSPGGLKWESVRCAHSIGEKQLTKRVHLFASRIVFSRTRSILSPKWALISLRFKWEKT